MLKAWDQTAAANPLKRKISEQIAALRGWDLRWSATSVPTTLAIAWGDDQATRHSTGDLRDVYFYRPQLEVHIEKQYHPGQ